MKKITKSVKKAAKNSKKKTTVKKYYEAESWQFSGCGD